MGARTDRGKMAAMCGRSTPLDEISSLYLWLYRCCCHAKKCPGDVILAFERLLSASCYKNASITSPGHFLEVTHWRCIKYLNNAIYPRASRIILRYLRPACLYFTCNKPSKTTMCLMFDCVRKVVDSLVCHSVKVSKFQEVFARFSH